MLHAVQLCNHALGK